jgi:hypothetical protein
VVTADSFVYKWLDSNVTEVTEVTGLENTPPTYVFIAPTHHGGNKHDNAARIGCSDTQTTSELAPNADLIA